jgi:hypothetical protein
MKKIIIILFVVLAQQAFAQYTKENLTMGDQNTFQNLQLYPIRANKAFEEQHRDVGHYTTLQNGLKGNKVKVTESSQSGSVNKLFIENVSPDTIMILAGEVVQGGKQDRVISNDFILYPGSGKKDLDVFCVESGRWVQNGSGSDFKSYYSISSKEVRKAAAVDKNQGKVWEKVAETNNKNQINTSTNALTAMKDSDTFKAQLASYQNWFKDKFKNSKDVIGVIAVSGKTVIGCDMFATHDIFSNYYTSLIDSYATEAITSGGPVKVTEEEVTAYLLNVISDEATQESRVLKNGTLLKEKGRKYHISTF